MFTPNKVKEIRIELKEIVILLNDKAYTTALACVIHTGTLVTRLGKEIQERSEADEKANEL